MQYERLLVLVVLASYAVASTAFGLLLVLLWQTKLGIILRQQPGSRLLACVRLIPTLAGGAAAAAAAAAFVLHEPRGTTEAPSALLLLAATVGATLLAASTTRLLLAGWRTFRFIRGVEGSGVPIHLEGVKFPAWQIELAFPLIAVTGVLRPRLVIATDLLDHVPHDELEVMVRHELAHVRRGDNLQSILLACLPDLLTWTRTGRTMRRAWHEAAEQAADELASSGLVATRLCLASALVRVAKRAGSRPAPPWPVLAIYGGESMERRVRRLLDDPAPSTGSQRASWLWPLAVASLVTASGLALPSLLRLHSWMEWLVNAHI